MRILVFLAIILLPACSTTQTDSGVGKNEPGVITSSNAEFGRVKAQRPQMQCRRSYVLVCNSDDKDAVCKCESQQRFRFDRSLPSGVNPTQ